MKFELKPDNRNASDEELINDLIKVANKLKKNTITINEYDKHGRFSEGTLRKRFGGWVKALEKASFSASRNGNLSNEEIIAELKRIAKLLGVKFLTTEQFNKHKKLSNTTTITKRFGSWNKALKKAGLNVSPNYKKQYSDNELFENLLNLWGILWKTAENNRFK